MNEEDKLKTAEWLGLKNDKLCHWTTCKCIENNIELRREKIKLNKEIRYKDEIINLMAEDRAEISEPKVSKEAIIDFFYKKVEEENE